MKCINATALECQPKPANKLAAHVSTFEDGSTAVLCTAKDPNRPDKCSITGNVCAFVRGNVDKLMSETIPDSITETASLPKEDFAQSLTNKSEFPETPEPPWEEKMLTILIENKILPPNCGIEMLDSVPMPPVSPELVPTIEEMLKLNSIARCLRNALDNDGMNFRRLWEEFREREGYTLLSDRQAWELENIRRMAMEEPYWLAILKLAKRDKLSPGERLLVLTMGSQRNQLFVGVPHQETVRRWANDRLPALQTVIEAHPRSAEVPIVGEAVRRTAAMLSHSGENLPSLGMAMDILSATFHASAKVLFASCDGDYLPISLYEDSPQKPGVEELMKKGGVRASEHEDILKQRMADRGEKLQQTVIVRVNAPLVRYVDPKTRSYLPWEGEVRYIRKD